MTRWLWTGADGLITDLSEWASGTYVIGEGMSGLFAPEYEFATESYAGTDGEQLHQVNARSRTTVLGIDLVASDGAELRGRLRALAHALRPRAGIGSLAAVADDGSTRTIPAYYRKGLEAGSYVVNRYRTALEFWSPSSWWQGTPLTYPWSLAAPTTFFPILPMRLSASSIQGTVTFDLSDTDTPTYPLWIITGPGTQLMLSNTWTGQDDDGQPATLTAGLVLNATIGDGQSVAIQTRPGGQYIRAATLDSAGNVTALGASLFGSLASDPAMFPLVDGVQDVTAVLTGAGAASRIAVTADRLYSGAL